MDTTNYCRLFFILLHAGVGIALLSSVAFVPSWRSVDDLAFVGSGISAINATIAVDAVPLNFWAWFYGLLVSLNYATSLPPIHCSGSGVACASYFLPGTVYDVYPHTSSFTQHPEADGFVVDNSIGYQIEFYPLSSTNELAGAICKVYGWEVPDNSAAVELCLKQSGNDLLAGLGLCPINSSCLSDTNWRNNMLYQTKVTISRRRATVVYSRSNNTILNVQNVSSPEPTTYDPVQDFFPIYDMAMFVPPNVALDYLYWIDGQGLNDASYDGQMLLRQFIAVPVGLFNDVYWSGIYPPDNQNTTGSLSISTYRVKFAVSRRY
jgi:hypothetical protein